MSEYDDSPHAWRQRWATAEAMADLAWEVGFTPEQVARMDARGLGRLARGARVNPPGPAHLADLRALLLTFPRGAGVPGEGVAG